MSLLRTALVSTLFGVSMSSFAAMPPSDSAAARDARMEEALQHFHAQQDKMSTTSETTTTTTTMHKSTHHAKHHRHAMKHSDKMKSADDKAKPAEQKQ
jgi:hypothetical protein